LPQEIVNCAPYLEEEFRILNQVKVYLALGQIGFRQLIKFLQPGKIQFSHNGIHPLPCDKYLVSSYHPSRQNTQTGKLKWEEWIAVFQNIKKLINSPEADA
jgi:uracil-DNA glycosylase